MAKCRDSSFSNLDRGHINSLAKRSSFRESSFVLKRTIRNFKEQFNENETKGNFEFQIYKFRFIFYFYFLCHIKMNFWYFDQQLKTWDLNRNYCSFFMLKILSYQKEETSKTDDVVDKPGTLFFWDEQIC